MKVAVSATGPELTSTVDQRFGRARYFLVVDTPERSVRVVDNSPAVSATQGAGVQAAQAVIDSGAEALITGHCGPKAFRVLQAAGVKVYLNAQGTVEEALSQLETGQLVEAGAPDVESHW